MPDGNVKWKASLAVRDSNRLGLFLHQKVNQSGELAVAVAILSVNNMLIFKAICNGRKHSSSQVRNCSETLALI